MKAIKVNEEISSFFKKANEFAKNSISYLQQQIIPHSYEWISAKQKSFHQFAEDHPGIVLIFGSVTIGLLAYNFRGNNEDDELANEIDETGEDAFKWQQSTAIKSDESTLMMKNQMEAIIELQEEEDLEDRLFFEVYKKYQQS